MQHNRLRTIPELYYKYVEKMLEVITFKMIIDIIISPIFLAIILPMVLYWVIVLLKVISRCVKSNKFAVQNILEDIKVHINKQNCYDYKTEIWKSVFLIFITLLEASTGLLYYTKFLIGHYWRGPSEERHYPFNRGDHCGHIPSKYITYVFEAETDILNTIDSLANCTDILVIALLICLMNYLTKRIKKIVYLSGAVNNKLLLTTTVIVCICIVILSSVYQLLNIGRMLFIVTVTVQFAIFVKTLKQFKLALHMRSMQHRIQHGSNAKMEEQIRYFKYTSSLLATGVFITLLSIIFTNICDIVMSYVFFGKCFFPSNMIATWKPYGEVLKTEEQFKLVAAVLKCILGLCDVLTFVGIFIIIVPFILFTLFDWLKQLIRRSAVYRFGYKEINDRLIVPS